LALSDAVLLLSVGSHNRRAAGYVDRILKSEKPADLPVEAPTKYELVIKLKTAKTPGASRPRHRGDRIRMPFFAAVHESGHGTFRAWPRWPTMSAVGGTAEVVARLVFIIEGWLASLFASPKIFPTQMMIVNEGPLLAQRGRS
jgi:hypothetical protein